jgi:hypothetical protein
MKDKKLKVLKNKMLREDFYIFLALVMLFELSKYRLYEGEKYTPLL